MKNNIDQAEKENNLFKIEREKQIENNLKIAQFMGYKKSYYDHGINGKAEIWKLYDDDPNYFDKTEFDYHYNYNSLMNVVKRIQENENINRFTISFQTNLHTKEPEIIITVKIINYPNKNGYLKITDRGNDILETIYEVILETISQLNYVKEMETLKPCPFCNSEVIMYRNITEEDYNYIKCTNKECIIHDIKLVSNNKIELIKKWNNRNINN